MTAHPTLKTCRAGTEQGLGYRWRTAEYATGAAAL